MDPTADYTPERLFTETMQILARHPRVLSSLGTSLYLEKEQSSVQGKSVKAH